MTPGTFRLPLTEQSGASGWLVKLMVEGEPFAQPPFRSVGSQLPIGVFTATPWTMTEVVLGAVIFQGRLVAETKAQEPSGPPENEALLTRAKVPLASVVPLKVAVQPRVAPPFTRLVVPLAVNDPPAGDTVAAEATLAKATDAAAARQRTCRAFMTISSCV